MGLRRLRARLDQLQGEANLTLDDARDLLADFQDGFGVTISVDAKELQTIIKQLLVGNMVGKIKLPFEFHIDPTKDSTHV
jgi:hypothetical protein